MKLASVWRKLGSSILIAMLLTACGAPEEAEKTSPVTFEEMAQDVEEAHDVADIETEDAGDSTEKVQPEKRVVHSVAEYAELEDNVYLDEERKALLKSTSAIEIYDSYLRSKWISMEFISSEDMRMGLGWVDEDDLPELFLCAGDFTASGVMIFTIDADTKEVISLGEFSQFGNCIFTERKNRIWSQYGNQGYFQECISMIDNGKAKLIGGIISDGSGVRADGMLYYAGFPISEEASGSREDMDFGLSVFDIPDEENYLVDEDAYVDAYHELMCDKDGAVKIQMDYDAMITIEPDETQAENDVTGVDYSAYDELIKTVTDGMKNGFSDDQYMTMGIVEVSISSNSSYEILGYLRKDLDGDGIDELLFGANSPGGKTVSEGAWDSIIYELYTLKDGEPVHVMAGGARCRYYLCTNGMIGNEGSSGAAFSSWAYYRYSDGKLIIEESVFTDEDENLNMKWHHSKQEPYTDGATDITQEEAQKIIDAYPYQELKFTPFVG